MTSFNLTARLNLQGPFGVKPVVDKLRRQVQNVTGNVGVKIDSSAISNVNALNKSLVSLESRLSNIASLSTTASSNLSNLGKAQNLVATGSQRQARNQAQSNAVLAKTAQGAAEAASEMEEFGRVSGLAIRRFAGFTIATGVIFGFINALQDATSEAISFERELAKVAQVSGTTLSNLTGLTNQITQLATGFGVSSSALLTASRTLKQAGFTAREVAQSLEAITKTDLAPTFDSITTTTEGSIAVLRQFGLEANRLESVLGSINRVAGQFAVESGDIIAAIRRAGGVFSAAAGTEGTAEAEQSVREFIALFTSVRATTRETAESIAVGLRTVFSRLQRGTTIDALRELNVELTDLEGQFVGPFEAIERLSQGLQGLASTDVRFSAIVEELGGIRQIGKIIPLIKQFGTAQKALQAAQEGTNSLNEDSSVALETLQNQIVRTRENFLALIRDVSQSDTFKFLATSALSFANSLISIASAIKPLIPLIAAIGAIRAVPVITEFGRGFKRGAGADGRNAGGGGDPRVGAQVAGLTQNTAAINQNTTAERAGSAVERASAGSQSALVAATQANTAALNLTTSSVSRLAGLLASGGVSFALGQSRNKGGIIKGFNRGGMIPGSSNSDTELIRAQPGEFMMNRRAVRSVGVETLQELNRGGSVTELREDLDGLFRKKIALRPGATGTITSGSDELLERSDRSGLNDAQTRARSTTAGRIGGAGRLQDSSGIKDQVFGAAFLKPAGFKSSLDGVVNDPNVGDIAFRLEAGALRDQVSQGIEENILSGIVGSVNEGSRQLAQAAGISGGSAVIDAAFLKKFNVDNVVGNIFEGVVAKTSSGFGGKETASAAFDFPNGLGSVGSNFTNSQFLSSVTTDAKNTVTQDAFKTIFTKVRSVIADEARAVGSSKEFQTIQGFENRLGGSVASPRARRGSSAGTLSPTKNNIARAKSLLAKNPGNLLGISDGALVQAGSYKNFRAGRPDSEELRREFLNAVANSKGAGGRLKKFQFGGMSNRKQPVALTPGELVFDPGATARAGVSALERFNASGDTSKIKGFNEGGGISQVPGTGNSDTFFTSLPTGSFVVRKSFSEQALAEGFNKGGRVGFGSGGGVRRRLVDGGGLPDFSALERRLAELDQNLRALNDAAVRAAQEAGRSVSKVRQLNREERAGLSEARQPLIEERASVSAQLSSSPERISPSVLRDSREPSQSPDLAIPRSSTPFPDPSVGTRELQALVASGEADRPVPEFRGPQAQIPELERALREGAFDGAASEFKGSSTERQPATERGDFLRDFEGAVSDVLGGASSRSPLDDLVDLGLDRRSRSATPGDEFSDIASSRNAGFNANAFDVSGSAASASPEAFGAAAQDNASVRQELERVQKQETLSIVKKIKAEDASIGSAQAKAQAEKQLRAKYGVLAKEIDNDSRLTKTLNSAKQTYSKALQTASAGLKKRSGESNLGRAGRIGGNIAGAAARGTGRVAGGIGRGIGRGIAGAGNRLGSGNLAFASFAAAPLIQGAFGQDDPNAAATGAGLAGALTGVTSGAATGAIFGPIGAALGGAVGGLTAGVTAAQSAFEETAKRIREADTAKAIEDFTKNIEELNKSGALNFNELNTALAALGNEVAENIKLEASTRGSFDEQGGFGAAASNAFGNAFNAARNSDVGNAVASALGSINIPLPEFEDITAANVLGGIGNLAQDLDKTLTDNLGGFGSTVLGGPLLKAVSFFSSAQQGPETEAEAAAFEQFAKDTGKELAGANQSLQQAGAKAIEDAIRKGQVQSGDVSGLDDNAFLALASANAKAQEAAIIAAKGIDDETAATAKRVEVLIAEGKKLAVTEAQRIQEEIDMEKAIRNTTTAVDQSKARFDALSRAMSLVSTAGDKFRSEMELLNGQVSDINLNPLSEAIDLISNEEFATAQQGIRNTIPGNSGLENELSTALQEIRTLRSIGPNIAAEVAARSSTGTLGPEATLRQILSESGLGGTGIQTALTDSLNKLFGADRQGFDSSTTIVEGDVQKVIDALSSQYQEVLKAGDQVIKAQQNIASEILNTSTLYSDTIKAANDKLQSAAELNANRSLRLREITGEDINVSDVFRNLTERVNQRTRRGGAGNVGARPGEIADEIRALRAQQVQLNRVRQRAGETGNFRALEATTDALNKNSRQQEALESALDLLANDVTTLTKVESELANIQKQRDQGRGLLQEVAEASVDPAKAIELNRKIAAGVALLQGGPLAAGQIDLGADFLRQLAAITGQENNLNEVLDARFAQILGNIGGFDAAEIRKFVETTVGKRGEENELKTQFQQLTALQANALKQQAGLLQNTATAIQRAGLGIIGEIRRSFDAFLTRIPAVFRNIRPGRGFQTGGFVSGGPFVPGEDTIPANLQPGEFVVRRDVVKKRGVGSFLKNLNSGRVGFQDGGQVKDPLEIIGDLTPEEFALQKNTELFRFSFGSRRTQERLERANEAANRRAAPAIQRVSGAVQGNEITSRSRATPRNRPSGGILDFFRGNLNDASAFILQAVEDTSRGAIFDKDRDGILELGSAERNRFTGVRQDTPAPTPRRSPRPTVAATPRRDRDAELRQAAQERAERERVRLAEDRARQAKSAALDKRVRESLIRGQKQRLEFGLVDEQGFLASLKALGIDGTGIDISDIKQKIDNNVAANEVKDQLAVVAADAVNPPNNVPLVLPRIGGGRKAAFRGNARKDRLDAINARGGLTRSEAIRQFNNQRFAQKARSGVRSFGSAFNGVNSSGRFDGVNSGGRLDGLFKRIGDPFGLEGTRTRKEPIPFSHRQAIFDRAGGRSPAFKKRAIDLLRDNNISSSAIYRAIKISERNNGTSSVEDILNFYKKAKGKRVNIGNRKNVRIDYLGEYLDYIQNSGIPKGFQNGGSVDTVPAMLQPGEFVVKRDVANKNLPLLNKLNSGRVQGFANGGVVGFQNGGVVGGSGGGGFAFMELISPAAITAMSNLSSAFITFSNSSSQLASSIDNFAAVAINLNRVSDALNGLRIPDRIELQVAPIEVNATVSVLGSDENVELLKQGLEQVVEQRVRQAINNNIDPITGETSSNFVQ